MTWLGLVLTPLNDIVLSHLVVNFTLQLLEVYNLLVAILVESRLICFLREAVHLQLLVDDSLYFLHCL